MSGVGSQQDAHITTNFFFPYISHRKFISYETNFTGNIYTMLCSSITFEDYDDDCLKHPVPTVYVLFCSSSNHMDLYNAEGELNIRVTCHHLQ